MRFVTYCAKYSLYTHIPALEASILTFMSVYALIKVFFAFYGKLA